MEQLSQNVRVERTNELPIYSKNNTATTIIRKLINALYFSCLI